MEDKTTTNIDETKNPENKQTMEVGNENISAETENYLLSEASDEESEEEDSNMRKLSKRKSLRHKTERIPIDEYFAKIPESDEGEKPEMQISSRILTSSRELTPQELTDDIKNEITFNVIRKLFVRPNIYSPPNRFITMTKNLHKPYIIVENNINCTPKKQFNADDPKYVKRPMLKYFPNSSFVEIKPDDFLIKGRRLSKLALESDSFGRFDPKIESSSSESDTDELASEKGPVMYPLTLPIREKVDTMRVLIKIKESPTVIFFSMTSTTADVNEQEGLLIAEENELKNVVYNRLRKKTDDYCQTSNDCKTRSVETQLTPNIRFNKRTFASDWELYDSLKMADEEAVDSLFEEPKVGKVTKIIYAETKLKCQPIVEKDITINNSLKWYKAAMRMERVLLSNNALKRQLVFHDLMKSNPLSQNVQFKYNLVHLWTLKSQKTDDVSVTCMSWNRHDKNILAVGHGKYNFSDENFGVISIWNNKNLAHPERQYTFEHAVTNLKFSKKYPDILAVAFYSGWILLINILETQKVKIIARNMPSTRTAVTPVWDIAWKTSIHKDAECIVECRGDGYVYEYIKRHLSEKTPIMRISKMKGKIKGILAPKKCQPYTIPMVRHPAILCISLHPDDSTIYLLGSEEGGVYKCSIQDAHQYLDMFLAHNGPVYAIQFHPACSKIFLTCGADWCIRIWGEGIFTPLITMCSGTSAVQYARWSPNLPTIIVAITSSRIELWDISRRITVPQAVYVNPKSILNTSLSFSTNGENLCVGDKAGNIHVYTVYNMPFNPSNPDIILALIMIKALTPNPRLLRELYKLGPPFNVSRIYKTYLNLV